MAASHFLHRAGKCIRIKGPQSSGRCDRLMGSAVGFHESLRLVFEWNDRVPAEVVAQQQTTGVVDVHNRSPGNGLADELYGRGHELPVLILPRDEGRDRMGEEMADG